MSASRLRYALSSLLVLLSLWAIGHFALVYAGRRLWLGLLATVALLMLLVFGALSFSLARRRLGRELAALKDEGPGPPETIIGRRREQLLSLQRRGGRPDVSVLEKQAAAELGSRAYLGRYFVTVAVLVGLLGTFAGLMETLGGVAALLRDEGRSLQSMLPLLGAPLAGLEVTFGASMAGILVTVTLALFQGDLLLTDELVLAALEDYTQHELIPRLWPAAQEPAALLLAEIAALRGDVRQAATAIERVQEAGREQVEQMVARTGAQLRGFAEQSGARLEQYAEATAEALQRHAGEGAALMDSRLRQSGEAISVHARRMTSEVEQVVQRLSEAEEKRRQERDAAQAELVERLTQKVGDLAEQVGASQQVLVEGLTQKVGGLAERLSTDQQALVEGLTQKVGGLAEQVGASQQVLVEGLTQRVGDLAERLGADQQALVGRLGALLEESVQRTGLAAAQMAERSAIATEQALRGAAERVAGYAGALEQAEQARTSALVEAERGRAADHAELQRRLAALLDEGIERPVREHLRAWQESAQQARDAAQGMGEVAAALERAVGQFGASAGALLPPLQTLGPELQALSAEVALLCARADEQQEPLPQQLLHEIIRLAETMERLDRRLAGGGLGEAAVEHRQPAG